MRLLGLSRIGFSVLSLSLAVLLASCLPPSADRNSPDNSTSIDPALAFDIPGGDPEFPNQPVEDFLTPMQLLDESDSVSPNDPFDEPMPDLDLDLTLGAGEPDLELPEPDVDLPLEEPDDVEAGPSKAGPPEPATPDRAADDDPVDKKAFEDLYPDEDLPDKADGSVAGP